MVCVVKCASFTIRVKNQLPTLVKCLISNESFYWMCIYQMYINKTLINRVTFFYEPQITDQLT